MNPPEHESARARDRKSVRLRVRAVCCISGRVWHGAPRALVHGRPEGRHAVRLGPVGRQGARGLLQRPRHRQGDAIKPPHATHAMRATRGQNLLLCMKVLPCAKTTDPPGTYLNRLVTGGYICRYLRCSARSRPSSAAPRSPTRSLSSRI
eukprot:1498763-Pleurochrysis_carterae.AAC.4